MLQLNGTPMHMENQNIKVRRWTAGALAGIVPGVILAIGVEPFSVGLVGPFLGALYGIAFRTQYGTALDHALTGGALALPCWVCFQVMAIPLVATGQPAWTVPNFTAMLPTLGVWSLAGLLFGVSVPLIERLLESVLGPMPRREPSSTSRVRNRILVIGGGFAGLTTARRLEECFGPDPSVELTMVNDSNSILFTPMLPEVAGGSVEPSHITSPLRTSLRRTRVIQATMTDLDPESNIVRVQRLGKESTPNNTPPPSRIQRGVETAASNNGNDPPSLDVDMLQYNHLALTLGSVPFHMGVEGIREHAFNFKTLWDGMRIRNHAISCFERAEAEKDEKMKRALTTFVIAGAGFAGAELAGALNDLVRGIQIYYPNVPAEDIRVCVVHAEDRILPELSESLAQHAHECMRQRGVEFDLNTKVNDAEPGVVHLSSGESIRTETFIWTAGNRPDPLLETLDVPCNERGGVIVDEYLSIPGRRELWAAGDCAVVTDAERGTTHPSTAQHAVRQGQVLAENIHASVTGQKRKPISYQSQGQLCMIGHQSACAEIKGWCFSGLFAWMLWRILYLFKLPGTDRKIRVCFDWLVELFFPRDMVQTLASAPPEERKERAK